MSTKDGTVNIHIFHSMKGGCGKSACALFKALALLEEKQEIENVPSVLFMDADFRGSAWQELLFPADVLGGVDAGTVARLERKYREKGKGSGLQHCFAIPDNLDLKKNLSQYLQGNITSLEEILYHSFNYVPQDSDLSPDTKTEIDYLLEGKLLLNGYIDFVLAQADAEGKNLFHYRYEDSRYQSPMLSTGLYLHRMRILLDEILNRGKVEGKAAGQYKDIVIDMPPSFDEYSEILLFELQKTAYEKNKGKKDGKIELHYYAVSTADAGHLKLTADNVRRMLKYSASHEGFSQVNVVFNSVTQGDLDYIDHKGKVKEIEELLEGKGKLYKKGHEKGYYAFCRNRNTRVFSCGVGFEEIKW